MMYGIANQAASGCSAYSVSVTTVTAPMRRRRYVSPIGRIGSAEAVPMLMPMLRRQDPKITRAAITALAGIDDPSAARAIHTVLRSSTGEQRRAVVDALVAGRDTRVVPMLVRILEESEPLGRDTGTHNIGTDDWLAHLKRANRTRTGQYNGEPLPGDLFEQRAFWSWTVVHVFRETTKCTAGTVEGTVPLPYGLGLLDQRHVLCYLRQLRQERMDLWA